MGQGVQGGQGVRAEAEAVRRRGERAQQRGAGRQADGHLGDDRRRSGRAGRPAGAVRQEQQRGQAEREGGRGVERAGRTGGATRHASTSR
ncbi:hypothetical protein [Streptomyces collinus]|uniref:hypothetical protein n=1 Tax=Streptomyces collinus TaxID=42684 RepID=UPI003645D02C